MLLLLIIPKIWNGWLNGQAKCIQRKWQNFRIGQEYYILTITTDTRDSIAERLAIPSWSFQVCQEDWLSSAPPHLHWGQDPSKQQPQIHWEPFHSFQDICSPEIKNHISLWCGVNTCNLEGKKTKGKPITWCEEAGFPNTSNKRIKKVPRDRASTHACTLCTKPQVLDVACV